MPRRKGLCPTERDLRMASDLGEALVMDVPLFHRHFPADMTGDSCLRRLRKMVDAKLIAQVIPELTSARNAIFRLTDHGAAWLAYHTGSPPRRLLHAEPKAISVPHRLHVSRIVLAFNDAAKAAGIPKPDWILEYDRLPDAPSSVPIPQQFILAEDFFPMASAADRPAELYGPPQYNEASRSLLKSRPDAACLVTLPSDSTRLAFYIEADNGTETHSQFLKKLPTIHALFSTSAYRRHWPDHQATLMTPRSLLIFMSAQRRDNIIERIRSNPIHLWHCPPRYQPTPDDIQRAQLFLDKYFRFAALEDVIAADMFASPIWRTISGQGRSIYPPPST